MVLLSGKLAASLGASGSPWDTEWIPWSWQTVFVPSYVFDVWVLLSLRQLRYQTMLHNRLLWGYTFAAGLPLGTLGKVLIALGLDAGSDKHWELVFGIAAVVYEQLSRLPSTLFWGHFALASRLCAAPLSRAMRRFFSRWCPCFSNAALVLTI